MSHFDSDALVEKNQDNPYYSCKTLATEFNCSPQTIANQLKKLGYRSVLDKWIPHDLSFADKHLRMSISHTFYQEGKEAIAGLTI